MSRRPHRAPPRSAVITAEGKQRLEQEYQRLWSVERPRVAREVGEAAALGDRSENAEYIYGKRRLREIDSRLEFLSRRLDELRVIAPEDRGDGVVRFGAWVQLAGERRPAHRVPDRRARRVRRRSGPHQHGLAARPGAARQVLRRRGHGAAPEGRRRVRDHGRALPDLRRRAEGPQRTFVRYVALEAPGWVLAAWLLVVARREGRPRAVARRARLGAVRDQGFRALPVAARRLRRRRSRRDRAARGPHGRARERLDPSGYVRIGAELWRAELAPGCAAIEAGARVRVREVRGLTLIVESC